MLGCCFVGAYTTQREGICHEVEVSAVAPASESSEVNAAAPDDDDDDGGGGGNPTSQKRLLARTTTVNTWRLARVRFERQYRRAAGLDAGTLVASSHWTKFYHRSGNGRCYYASCHSRELTRRAPGEGIGDEVPQGQSTTATASHANGVLPPGGGEQAVTQGLGGVDGAGVDVLCLEGQGDVAEEAYFQAQWYRPFRSAVR